MSVPSELWKKWQGRTVADKFPLKKWVGGSDHSVVYLTERNGPEPAQAALKFVSACNIDADVQLSRWADAAKLSHPHLIRLFEWGRCEIDNISFLYVVMEFAEENLAEIIPLRPLAAAEVSEMLPPAIDALTYLHRAGYAHGRLQPSNIAAVNNKLKISSDSVTKIGESILTGGPNRYSAPELTFTGPSAAADVWSLGSTIVAVMTQNETLIESKQASISVPEIIPEPLRETVRKCLLLDPQQRPSLASILKPPPVAAPAKRTEVVPASPQSRSRLWIVIAFVVAALFAIAIVGVKFSRHPVSPPTPSTPAMGQPSASSPEASPIPAPESQNTSRNSHGSVQQKVMPEVSRGAQNTITGHIKVSVQVSVDAAGDVTQAKFISEGPSKYFAQRAIAAARSWKFKPPQVNGQAAASEWILRFQFGRSSTQVFSTETSPSS